MLRILVKNIFTIFYMNLIITPHITFIINIINIIIGGSGVSK